MASPTIKPIPVVSRTFFCSDKEHMIKIDAQVVGSIMNQGQNNQYIAFNTSFYLKIEKKDSTVPFVISLDAVMISALASHTLSQIDGFQDSNFEAPCGPGGTHIVRAGILRSGPGISMYIGGIEEYAPLDMTKLRGFAEMIKAIVIASEQRMAIARAKDENRR